MGIATFSSKPSEWEDYINRLENCFIAHDMKEGVKNRAILLSKSRAATYKLICSLVALTKPSEVDYKDLLTKVKAHFALTLSTIVQRYKFKCVCQQSKTVAAYVARLRALSTHYDYGNMLDHLLRDRLVCGKADIRLQCRLWQNQILTFPKGVEIAQAAETMEIPQGTTNKVFVPVIVVVEPTQLLLVLTKRQHVISVKELQSVVLLKS